MLAVCAQAEELPPASHQFSRLSEWRREIIYLAVLDRFADGSTANNNAQKTDRRRATFFHGGDLKGLTQRLDYLEQLGVTAIWITPLYRQVGRVGDSYGYHGYWFEDPFQIDPQFGTSQEFHSFLKEAHRRGFKVLLDMVVNHAGYGASLVKQHPDWFHTPQDPQNEETGSLAGLPDFKQENPQAAAYLKRVVKYWIDTYSIDGIRMDTVKHVPHFFWRDLIREVDTGIGMKAGKGRPDLFWVGEVLDGNRGKLNSYLEDGFESVFDFAFQRAIWDGIGRGGSTVRLADAILDSQRHDPKKIMSLLVDNHDMPRFISTLGYGVKEARDRLWLAYALIMTLPGIPQIYYGDEVGLYGTGDPENRHSLPDWALNPLKRSVALGGEGLSLPLPASTFAYLSNLTRIRTQNPSLSIGSYRELWRQSGGEDNVLAYLRGDGNAPVLVVLNNSTKPTRTMTIPLRDLSPQERTLFEEGNLLDDLLGGGTARMTADGCSIDLEALSAKVLKPRQAGEGMSELICRAQASCGEGEILALVGNIPELGQWNPQKALPLHQNAGSSVWEGHLRYLRSGTAVEYKLIKLRKSTDSIVWQSGGNGRLRVTASPQTFVKPTWN